MMNEDYSPVNQPTPKPGPFLAIVVSHLDPSYMGGLEVEILRPGGGSMSEGNLHQVKYMSPFYGVTPIPDSKDENQNTYNNTQQSYGMWMVPPDVGSTVIVIFIEGDPKKGYWIGCVQDENMNFMVPGIAATKQIVDARGDNRTPAGEYNKSLNNQIGDPDQFKKPRHPFADVLAEQGLLRDDVRGITTSSARRETPSMVFGLSTPGPLDKTKGARQGPIGKAEHKVLNAYLSRLGGSSFVMDDGDDKFLRKKPASDGPPEYAAVEQGETDGDVTLPHNELIRLRTRTGHQILLHNSEDLIYIGNARGTTWIELTSNGKIDIYAEDSISMHTKGDFNVTADKNINLTSAGSINLKSGGNSNFTTAGSTNIKSGGNHLETAAQIHMNGPAAATATAAPRVPQHEPWAGHENLHRPSSEWNKAYAPTYSTKTDTFAKDKGTTK